MNSAHVCAARKMKDGQSKCTFLRALAFHSGFFEAWAVLVLGVATVSIAVPRPGVLPHLQ